MLHAHLYTQISLLALEMNETVSQAQRLQKCRITELSGICRISSVLGHSCLNVEPFRQVGVWLTEGRLGVLKMKFFVLSSGPDSLGCEVT